MDYVEMLKDSELVYGFQELVGDAEPVVVKRTIKVFTSVYFHSLRLVSLGELEEATFLKAWISVKGVVDTLLGMVNGCENEGVLMYLLRFVEAAITSHLIHDFTAYPEVYEKSRDVVKAGLRTLKNLVTTPYVGGSSFIVGVRALITVACLRQDLWEPVTDLLNNQLTSLPPTLFDHNVRSLNKSLQRNLFRLLRRAESSDLKEKLIEMMVAVGMPRKTVLPWAPPASTDTKKRPVAEPISEEYIVGRVTPPNKKTRPESGRSTPEEAGVSQSSRPNTPDVPKDPRIKVSNNVPPVSRNSDFVFLSSLIPKTLSTAFSKEKEIFDKLNMDGVIRLIFEGLDSVPDMEPKDFVKAFKEQSKISTDIEEMRKHVAYMMTKDITDQQMKALIAEVKENRQNKASETIIPLTKEPVKVTEVSVASLNYSSSNSSSESSSPCSTPPPSDTDFRQLYSQQQPRITVADVDMRVTDQRIVSRDPRITRDPRLQRDPRLRKEGNNQIIPPATSSQYPLMQSGQSPVTSSEPTATVSNTRVSSNDNSVSNPETRQRKTRWDPRPGGEITPSQINPHSVLASSSNVVTDPRVCKSPLHSLESSADSNQATSVTQISFPGFDSRFLHPPPSSFQSRDPRVRHDIVTTAHFPLNAPIPTHRFLSGNFVPGLQFPSTSMHSHQLIMNGPSPSVWPQSLHNPSAPVLVARALTAPNSGILPSPVLNL